MFASFQKYPTDILIHTKKSESHFPLYSDRAIYRLDTKHEPSFVL